MFSTWGDIAYRFRRVIPLVIIFFIGAKQFMSGITEGAVKG